MLGRSAPTSLLVVFAFAFFAVACVGTRSMNDGADGAAGLVPSTAPGTTVPVGQGGLNGSLDPAALNDPNFAPLTSRQAGSKVKALLTGLALTTEEDAALSKNPDKLGDLVDVWLETPQWRKVMMDYFRTVFQTGTNNMFGWANDFISVWQTNQDWAWFGWHTWYDIISSLQDSFPRTVLQLIDEGQPFTQVLTTRRYMLNVPSMVMLAYFDSSPRTDSWTPAQDELWIPKAYPNAKYVRQAKVKIPFEQSMDPASPNFMIWYDPSYDPKSDFNLAWCGEPITFSWDGNNTVGIGNWGTSFTNDMVMQILYGGRTRCPPWSQPGASNGRAGVFSDSDWDTWKMVTIRPPKAGELPSLYMNVPALRRSNELVLHTEEAGFLTSLGFLQQWQTNPSNQDRALVNQALIVGLDYTLAPATDTATLPVTSDASMHAAPGTSCFGCHQTLDPMVAMFHNSYSLPHRRQVDPNQAALPGRFSVAGGDTVSGNGVAKLAAAMAAHPSFASGWVQKMCRFVNSAECDLRDPEFLKVVETFVSSNYNFKKMLRALMVSPITTYAAPTYSTVNDAGLSILRREQFCSLLEARLQWPDICQQRTHNIYDGALDADGDDYTNNLRSLASTLPATSFVRGHTTPAMPRAPDLFYVQGVEHFCAKVAEQMIDREKKTSAGASYPSELAWSSGDPNAAITAFVTTLMGVPPADARTAALRGALGRHFSDVTTSGAKPTDALRSTFTAACVSAATTTRGL